MNPPPHRRRRTIRFGRGSSTHLAGFGSRRRGASTEKMGNPSGGSCAPPPSLASRKRRRRWPFSVFPFPRPQQRRSRVWIRIYGTGQNRSKRREDEDEDEGEASLAGARQQTSWGAAGQRRGREGKVRDFCCGIFIIRFIYRRPFITPLPRRGAEEESGEHERKVCESAKACRSDAPHNPWRIFHGAVGGPGCQPRMGSRWALARRIPSSPVLGGKERRVPCG